MAHNDRSAAMRVTNGVCRRCPALLTIHPTFPFNLHSTSIQIQTCPRVPPSLPTMFRAYTTTLIERHEFRQSANSAVTDRTQRALCIYLFLFVIIGPTVNMMQFGILRERVKFDAQLRNRSARVRSLLANFSQLRSRRQRQRTAKPMPKETIG